MTIHNLGVIRGRIALHAIFFFSDAAEGMEQWVVPE